MRYKHICAVLDNGTVRCWGNGEGDQDTDLDGILGTLGKRIVGDNETPASEPVVNLGSGRTAKAVTAGWLQSCAILDTDQVLCWGQNNGGQLGLGNGVTPVAAADSSPINLGGSATAISSGRMHTCALLSTGAGPHAQLEETQLAGERGVHRRGDTYRRHRDRLPPSH